MFEDADANASARIILLPVETVADILIIEDDPSINEVVCAHLERRGYRCRQAFSGTEGLMLLREQRPDVVITDLMLPGVPGEEIVREKVMEFEPLTRDEALIKIDLLGHDFFAYTDRDTGMVNVLYRRDDGGYGLLKQKED